MARFLAFSPGSAGDVRVFFAPGRVNLIGEHIDYNGGDVFPAALKLGTWAFVRPRRDRTLRFASTSFPQEVTVSLDDLHFDPADDYANYPKGVAWALQQDGHQLQGVDVLYYGNLPNGAGLSSSASIELATAVAFNELAELGLDGVQMARIGQRAENQFVGVHCGIMDQFAVAMGKEQAAILLDCATLSYRHVPFDAGEYRIVIANTNKRRGLADSKYNERRAECEAALRQLQAWRPDLKFLAQLPLEAWPEAEARLANPVLRKRARHVVTEQARVHQAAACLAEGRLAEFGRLLNASHVSLRDDYEVTGPELDALAEAAWEAEGCIGSRMTGAGFGGCTVSLVHRDAIDAFAAQVAERYRRAVGLEASLYVSDIGDGAREVTAEVRTVCQG
ncbi:galactokinase [Alicyclobacillus cellulosilyticus]|uniref:galactokinase n=1 Tax=Alicyclobacillus cellulosilyticus TaxID=1003997 RepID=UPI001E526D86|nr:galactokinase [Alicyclobacillus cellulosilyticus]